MPGEASLKSHGGSQGTTVLLDSATLQVEGQIMHSASGYGSSLNNLSSR